MSDETDRKRDLRRARRRAKHLILSRRHLPREGFSYGLDFLTFQSPQDSKDLMRAMMKASGARTYILPVHRDNRLEELISAVVHLAYQFNLLGRSVFWEKVTKKLDWTKGEVRPAAVHGWWSTS
jgi:hypothetical protein